MKTFNFYEEGELEFIHGEIYMGMFRSDSFGFDIDMPCIFTIEYEWMLYDKKDIPYPDFVCYSENKNKKEHGKLGDIRIDGWIHKDEIKDGWYYKLTCHIPDHYDEKLMYYMTLKEYNEANL